MERFSQSVVLLLLLQIPVSFFRKCFRDVYNTSLFHHSLKFSHVICLWKDFCSFCQTLVYMCLTEDVIRNIHEASVGRHRITAREWQQLLAAVDQLYPDFKDALVMRTESLSEEQMKFCYLLRIGLSNPQIQNVIDMSRATVWRWSKKYGWVTTSNGK